MHTNVNMVLMKTTSLDVQVDVQLAHHLHLVQGTLDDFKFFLAQMLSCE